MLRIRYLNDHAKSFLNNISNLFDNFKWHQSIYLSALRISYVLFFLAFTGVFTLNPTYLTTLENFIKYYISIILIIRFNPFVKREVTNFDKKLVFSSALFLFISTAAFSVATEYLKNLNIPS